eukprot:COSAG01_NODE_107_length_25964_cov_174.577576_3_plen_75_part_00
MRIADAKINFDRRISLTDRLLLCSPKKVEKVPSFRRLCQFWLKGQVQCRSDEALLQGERSRRAAARAGGGGRHM